MHATYNITDDKLKVWFDSRLSEEDYKAARSAGFVYWHGSKCFTAKWSTRAEDFVLRFCEIEDNDTPDDVEARVERFAGYSEVAERSAEYADAALEKANTERRRQNAINAGKRNLDAAEHWQERIEGAIRHAAYKERPDVIARRIKGLETDLRRQQKIEKEAANQRAMWDDAQLDYASALQLANYGPSLSRCFLKSEFPLSTYEGEQSLWGVLDKQQITVEQAKAFAVARHSANLARALRWIAHLENRLLYERACLTASGYVAPVKRKSLKQSLPLLNYRQEMFATPNRYHRHETEHFPQVEMSAKEYAALHHEYRGTAIIDGTHKVRIGMVSTRDFPHVGGKFGGIGRAAVFITDSKTHEKPEALQEVAA